MLKKYLIPGLIISILLLSFPTGAFSQKVLFVLSGHEKLGDTGESTGFYLSEAAHPWKELHDAGIEVDFTSPGGGEPPVTGFDLTDPVNKAFWKNEEVRNKLSNTLRPADVDPADYVAIHYVGGHGAMWDFPQNEEIAEIARKIYEDKGYVTAVCHGPAGLVNLKLSDGSYLIDGKELAAFTNEEEKAKNLQEVVPFLLEDKLEERGAVHIDAPNWSENVVVSGRLITGQNPASAQKLGKVLSEKIKENN